MKWYYFKVKASALHEIPERIPIPTYLSNAKKIAQGKEPESIIYMYAPYKSRLGTDIKTEYQYDKYGFTLFLGYNLPTEGPFALFERGNYPVIEHFAFTASPIGLILN